MKALALAVFTSLLGLAGNYANPVNLEAPANSIGAADPFGKLRIWREIDTVDFGNSLRLPLRVEFSSARQTDSPYAGRGFWIPLIEANAFLKRDSMLQATLPCGKSMFLRRSKSDSRKFYTLDKQWTGLIEGEVISTSRSDGWEIQYREGHIHRLKTDTGRIITWKRNGNVVTDIHEEGSSTLPLRLISSGSVIEGLR